MKPCELPAALEKLPFVASAKWFPADARDSSARVDFAQFCGVVQATTAEGYAVRVTYSPRHGPASTQRVRADGLAIAARLAQSMARTVLGLQQQ